MPAACDAPKIYFKVIRFSLSLEYWQDSAFSKESPEKSPLPITEPQEPRTLGGLVK